MCDKWSLYNNCVVEVFFYIYFIILWCQRDWLWYLYSTVIPLILQSWNVGNKIYILIAWHLSKGFLCDWDFTLTILLLENHVHTASVASQQCAIAGKVIGFQKITYHTEKNRKLWHWEWSSTPLVHIHAGVVTHSMKIVTMVSFQKPHTQKTFTLSWCHRGVQVCHKNQSSQKFRKRSQRC